MPEASREILKVTVADATAAQGDIMQRLTDLFQGGGMDEYISNPERIMDQLSDISATPATIRLDSAICVLRAAIDALAAHISSDVVGPTPSLLEALRRSQLDADSGEKSAAAMFGVSLAGVPMDHARDFVDVVIDAHGHESLVHLTQADGLPQPEELSEVTSWYERVRSSPLAN